MTHGSNTNARDLNDIEPDLDYDAPKKDKEAGVIPKLAEEDRQDVLPIVVKLLFSKLFKKKGVINQKSIGTRRTIVFQFLAGLDPSTEFPIFFKELLAPLGLAEAMELGKD